jgi:ATP-dependent helicase/nuclease subunit B
VHVRFLLGPAGSGKTFRCLAEIREELLRSPDGLPLVFLTPKQATFQLERQLLADPALPGYTRLQILSFDRLAEFTIAELGRTPRELLAEEGRVMTLRALLGRHQAKLKIFRSTARLPGFAQQLNLLLREFQRQQLSPDHLAAVANRLPAQPTLAEKLHDCSLLLEAYLDWLHQHDLEDADRLLDAATKALKGSVGGEVSGARCEVSGDLRTFPDLTPDTSHLALHLGGLWLDGFAEMTPQELDLLAAFLPLCDRATLAFCLDSGASAHTSWLSGWSGVADTVRQCRERISKLSGCDVVIESLKRDPAHNRFANNPALKQLEESWEETTRPGMHVSRLTFHDSLIRLITCVDPEAEAVLAAREILRFVRGGGRFREVAVLVRQLDRCHETIRRVFARYEIPFFLDRREPVAHHPLAELTRYALRLSAFNWQHEDWFGALKTGLVTDDESTVDRLENEALARGWQGNVWFEPLKTPGDPALESSINCWLEKILPPFTAWNRALLSSQRRPTGHQLAAMLRAFWNQLEIEKTLEQWTSAVPANPQSAIRNPQSAVHASVLEQMHAWLDTVELAFGDEPWPLGDWLPVLEAGLANLSVGVIPPALDQVLIGAIDRSRNPELRLAILSGWNETIFPALPEPGPLLSEIERDALTRQNVPLNPGRRQQIARERFYAYIACTRSRERLIITCAAHDVEGQPLNPSPFFEQVRQLTGAAEETFDGVKNWLESEHFSELAAPVLRAQAGPEREPALIRLGELPEFAPLVQTWRQIAEASAATRLAPGMAENIFGRELASSVSGLEDFAACPFKFFAARGLRLQERKEFQFDDRDKGSFQHEVLREFHQRIRQSGRRWRDLSPVEARDLVAAIGHELLPEFDGGKFLAAGAARFTGEFLIERLQRLAVALIKWMPQYGFDPEGAEIGFGLEPGDVPALKLELPEGRTLSLRGRIDRVDLCRAADGTMFAAVMDYKSRARSLNPTKLHHGLELQLLSYLAVLRQLAGPEHCFGAAKLAPAGAFYVPLNGGGRSSASRAEILEAGEVDRRAAYQHSGRFLADALRYFDNRDLKRGDQFKFAKNQDGAFSARGNEALPGAEFNSLREKIEGHLRDYARRIFEGETIVLPFRIGSETACDRCDFRSVCRFDPWVQPYRELRPPPKPSCEASASKSKTPVEQPA